MLSENLRLAVGIVSLVALLAIALTPAARGTEPVLEAGKLPPGSDAFSRALYGKLAEQEGNVAVSPASIQACVLLALGGARGETAAEIAKALQLSEQDAKNVGSLLDRALAAMRVPSGVPSKTTKLTIANSAWVQHGFPIENAYRQLLTTNNRAGFETVDFKNATGAARKAINAWVDTRTNHMIPQLLSPDAVPASTRLVLVNAVYFKARWLETFNKRATKEEPFRRPNQPDMPVQLMHQIGEFGYLETDTYQAVELSYVDSPYAMIVWLPKKVDGLPALEKHLATAEGIGELKNRRHTLVDLFLPRFKANSTLELADVLGELGMKLAFTANADFSGISREPIYVSAVVHQAVVEVDEEGTEAAAATAIVTPAAAAPPSEPPQPRLFRADHPFVYAIRHQQTGDVLFMGRVEKP